MLLKLISYIPAIVGLLIIAFFVYLNNPKNIKNRVFATLNVLIVLWLSSLFIGDTTQNVTIALWSLRFAGFFSSFMFLFFYYFALVFPYSSKISKSKLILYSSPMIFIALTSFSKLQVATVSIQKFGVQPEKIGPLYTALDVIGIIYLLSAIGILLYKYRRSNIQEKNQIKFILFGLGFAIAVNIFTGFILTLLKVDTDVILFGSFSLFIFSAFVAYTILKHSFLDVRLVVAKTLGYVLTIATIAGIYSAILFGIISRFIGTEHVTTMQQFIYILLAVFLAFTFQPIKKFFDKLSNKLFYRDAYEPQVLLNQLSSLLVSSIDLNKILNESAQIILGQIKAEFVVFHINKTENTPAKTFAIGSIDPTAFEKIFLEIKPKIKGKTIILEELSDSEGQLKHQFLDLKIAIVSKMVSLTQHNTTVGYLILGQKRSGNLYNKQDVRVINIIADELVIAVQNALRFEEIQQFNVTLQEKVDDATYKLRKANDKLRALDETKDEFISMASHQLRTPLTTVKGYVSMVLEGDAGKISDDQRKLLDQSFLSAQRMVYLIADLLNVSRLRTGKFVIDSSPTNLADLVEGEIESLKETAKGRHLELSYTKPNDFPVLMLDDTKIRQVVMNFADNAIYYTPAGGHIVINLEDKGESVEFSVVDNGIGVPKAVQHHLFSKFYRADNAKKARPDGTGLGLFMAQKVVVAQGGAIIFKSEEGKGSTFGFSFPKAKLKVPDRLKDDAHKAEEHKKEPSLL